MADLPQVSVSDVWGEGPLFARRCWLVRWPLSDSQLDSVHRFLRVADVWTLMRLLVPALNIKPSILRKVEAECRQEASCEHVVFALAQSMLSPAELRFCPLRPEVKADGVCFAVESNQHEILGAVVQLSINLLWECFSRWSGNIPFEPAPGFQAEHIRLVRLVRVCCDHPLTAALLAEASKREISFSLLDERSRTYHFGEGVQGRLCSSSANDLDSHLGATFANDKRASHGLLARLGVRVPKQISFDANSSDATIKQLINRIGFPCVVKPADAEQGKGVTSDIRDFEGLKDAIGVARRSTAQNFLLLQEHVCGSDYRLNVTAGRLEFVVKRSAPVITGNGADTVKACIEKLNASRRLKHMQDGLSAEIDVQDVEVLSCISSAGFELDSVIESGRTIPLRRNSNVSTGGLREEMSPAAVHPRIVSQCLSIAKTMRLDCCGVDYITTDIGLDPLCHPGAFIEVNFMPQQQPHRARDLMQNLFANHAQSTIPCTLLLAHWGGESGQKAADQLKLLMDQHPGATLACPLLLRTDFASCLVGDVQNSIHFFRHPNELLLNKSVAELICLMTPELLLTRGWILPRSRIKIVNMIPPSSAPASKALFQYLDGLDLSE